MSTKRFTSTALVLILGAWAPGNAALAATASGGLLHDGLRSAATVSATGLHRVAMPSRTEQLSGSEVEEAAVATWKGSWTNDTTGGGGDVTFRIEKADGGTVEGKGEAIGGVCERSFTISGWYRDSLVQLELALPAAGDKCPAANVSISMRVGRRGEQVIGVGHWSNSIEGRSAGKAFGFLELVRQ